MTDSDIHTNELQWIDLSAARLIRNVRSLKRLAGNRLLAVCVKSNAYGHGLAEIVSILCDLPEVDYLTVHSLEEAELCRQSGWTKKIILLGPFDHSRVERILELEIEPTISTNEALVALGEISRGRNLSVRTHLKLETGTNRQGLTESELTAVIETYEKYPSLDGPEGLSTHFANIEDTTNHEYALAQLAEFERLVSLIRKSGFNPKLLHTASSAALILFDKTRFDLVRPGISMYGHWPSRETYLTYRLGGGENNIFGPILSWRTKITQIKSLAADSFVGYGCTYRTTSPTKLAVLPVGYFDGYARALSNRAYVLIKGCRAPIRGRICMNLMMVDVTDIEGVRLGDQATLIGSDGEEQPTAEQPTAEQLTVEQLADWGGSINYEVLARLSPRIKRRVTP